MQGRQAERMGEGERERGGGKRQGDKGGQNASHGKGRDSSHEERKGWHRALPALKARRLVIERIAAAPVPVPVPVPAPGTVLCSEKPVDEAAEV